MTDDRDPHARVRDEKIAGTLGDRTALRFLVRAQRATNCTDRERGGFGASLASTEQRIDVTGHVARGFIKSVENGMRPMRDAGHR